MKKTQKFTIERIAYGGAGVARSEGIVYFIDFTIPGETVIAQVYEEKKNFKRAKLLEVTEPSAIRREPLCPYFTDCGGCQYQHIPYSQQCEIKHGQLIDIFTRIARVSNPSIEKFVAADDEFGYRNRITLHHKRHISDLVGFFSYDNTSIIPIKHCPIAVTAINDHIAAAAEHLCRQSKSENATDIIIATDNSTVKLCETRIGSNKQHDQRNPTQYLHWTYKNKRILFRPEGFFQTHFNILGKICTFLKDYLGNGKKTLIDAYGGVGVFSAVLSELYKKIYLIEENQHAIEVAKKNSTACSFFKKVALYPKKVEHALPHILKSIDPQETDLIIDPPRIGLSPSVVKNILVYQPSRIFYLSCEPSKMARDLQHLMQQYALDTIVPFDMFPQTKHIEVLAILTRKL